MKKGFFTLLLLIITALPSLAATTNTSGPWGIDIATFTSFSTAKRSPITAGKMMVITKPMTCNNLTVSEDRPIKIMPGGSLTVAAGKTAIIKSEFKAKRRLVFPGAGQVRFTADANSNQSNTPTVYPEWWGAKGDDATDSTAAFQSAINSINAGTIESGIGVYQLSTINIIGKIADGTVNLVFKGQGDQSTFFRLNNMTGNGINILGSRFLEFRDFNVLSTAQHTAGAFIYAGINVRGTPDVPGVTPADGLVDTPSSTITFRRIKLNGKAYNGLHLYKCGGVILDYIQGSSTGVWNSFIVNEGNSGAAHWNRVVFGTSSGTTGPAFDLKSAPDGTGFDTISMYDCGVQKLGSAVIPWGLKAAGGEFLHVKNCFFEVGSAGGVGIWLAGANNVSITDTHAVTASIGIKITAGQNINISKGRLYHNGRHGLRIEGGRNINVDGVHLTDNGYGDPIPIAFAPAIPASGVGVTNTSGYALAVAVSGGTVTDILVNDVSAGVTSGSVAVGAGQTIKLVYSVAPTWVWPTLLSGQSTNLYDQIYVAANVSEFSLVDNTIGILTGYSYLARYGIYIEKGRSNKYIVKGNNIADFGTGAVFDGGLSGPSGQTAERIVSDNIGATENQLQKHGTVRTTSATPTVLWSKPIELGEVHYISATVLMHALAPTTVISAYTRSVLVAREGSGTYIQGGVQATESMEGFAGHDCTFVVSGNTIQLVVTGVDGGTYDWSANIRTMKTLDATSYGVLP